MGLKIGWTETASAQPTVRFSSTSLMPDSGPLRSPAEAGHSDHEAHDHQSTRSWLGDEHQADVLSNNLGRPYPVRRSRRHDIYCSGVHRGGSTSCCNNSYGITNQRCVATNVVE